MNDSAVHKKTLRQRDMVLFTVSAILLPDTLASAASIGASSISWWILLSIGFLMPFALISAELGCSYPEQGGVYAWVRDAFGARWGSRVTWCYWVNTAVWLPSVCMFFTGVLKQLFFPEASLGAQIAVAVGLCSLTAGVSCMALSIGKWVPNIGALTKFLFFFAIIVGATSFGLEHSATFGDGQGMANPLNASTLALNWGESLQFIPAIVYGMLGFELVSASSEEMRNPARDVPRATFYSGATTALLYTLGTFAILTAIPAGDINVVEGLVDALRVLYAGPNENLIVTVLGVSILFSVFASGATWAIGVNRAAAEAGLEGELPQVFSLETRAGGPLGASLLMAATSSSMLLVYGLVASSNADLFWSLFAFSGVIFFLPYIGMVCAFWRLRNRDRDHPRPFKVPGGTGIATLVSAVCIATLMICAGLFMYTPGLGPKWPVIGGVAAMLALGELVISWAERRKAALAAPPKI